MHASSNVRIALQGPEEILTIQENETLVRRAEVEAKVSAIIRKDGNLQQPVSAVSWQPPSQSC